MSALKLRAQPITQDMFDRLPALLTAYQVKHITGLDDHEIAAMVRAGTVTAHQRLPRAGRTRAYSKYTKVSVAKLCGFST